MMLIVVCLAVIVCSFQISGEPVIQGVAAGQYAGTYKDGNRKFVGREKYPYVVYLEINDKAWGDLHFCGGTIIRPRVVLTAAHCFTENSGNVEAYAIAGVLHLDAEKSNAQRIEVRDYLIHNKYSRIDVQISHGVEVRTAFQNDIALVWLEKRFIYSPKVNQIELMSPDVFLKDKMGFILGWGQTEKGTCANMLRRADLRVIPRNECEYVRSGRKYILNLGMLCTRSDTKTTQQCKGDSGGPFIVDNKLAGIISNSFKSDVNLPNGQIVQMSITEYGGVVTNVKNFHEWIFDNIKKGPPIDRKSKPKNSPIGGRRYLA